MADDEDWRRPGSASWRRTVHAHIQELETIADALFAAIEEPTVEKKRLKDGIDRHLREATRAVSRTSSKWPWHRLRNGLTGADVDGAMSHYTAAEVLVLRLAPKSYEQALMPSLLALTRRHLARRDPRRERMEELAGRGLSFSVSDGIAAAAIVGDVGKEARREIARARSFRNLLLGSATVLLVLAVGVGVFGWFAPEKLPLCFEPDRLIVCPTREEAVVNADALAKAEAIALAAQVKREMVRSVADTLAGRAAAQRRAAAAARAAVRRAREAMRAADARRAAATRGAAPATGTEAAASADAVALADALVQRDRARASTERARAALRRTRAALRRLRTALAAATARERAAIDMATADQKMRGGVSDPWDVPLVLVIGMLAGAVAAIASLRNSRGTAIPVALPTAQALLKLPTGALTAFLGIELMRGGFVPGLSALDSSAQIIAWAIVFGSSQELLTRLVDQRGGVLIDDVRPNRPDDGR